MSWWKKLFKKKKTIVIPMSEEEQKLLHTPKVPESPISISFIGPDGEKVQLSEADQNEMNEAIKELERIFGGNTLEAFMSGGRSVPFQTANGLPDGFHQLLEEMENHKFDTDHWSDEDFLEHLMSFYNKGYEFEGLEEMFNRYQNTKNLTTDDKQKVRNWYFLAAQEMVYDV